MLNSGYASVATGFKTSPFEVLDISRLKLLAKVTQNNDGLPDIVTGKRFWAYGPTGDVEPDAPAVLYWFELKRGANGQTSFSPHLIDDDSGVGTQVTAVDLNNDQRPDIIVANKKGVFLHPNNGARQTNP